jgi:hypothetical protein
VSWVCSTNHYTSTILQRQSISEHNRSHLPVALLVEAHAAVPKSAMASACDGAGGRQAGRGHQQVIRLDVPVDILFVQRLQLSCHLRVSMIRAARQIMEVILLTMSFKSCSVAAGHNISRA